MIWNRSLFIVFAYHFIPFLFQQVHVSIWYIEIKYRMKSSQSVSYLVDDVRFSIVNFSYFCYVYDKVWDRNRLMKNQLWTIWFKDRTSLYLKTVSCIVYIHFNYIISQCKISLGRIVRLLYPYFTCFFFYDKLLRLIKTHFS